jgi:hypothetical protein
MRNPCQASELAAEERAVLERIVGRPLEDTDMVGVTIDGTLVQPAPEGEARERAWQEMMDGMREMQERVKDVPEEELYALIDEAIEYVRNNPE